MRAKGHDVPAIGEIIAPVEIGTFLSEYWETKPLVVSRRSPGRYADLVSLTGVVDFITSTELRESDLRLVRDGAPLPAGAYTRPLPWADSTTDGIVKADTVFAEYHAGATIILEALQRKWKPLTLFCRRLEAYFHQGVQANVYLTPQNCQGFSVHYDTHDVFVLQAAGSKRWRIYRPVIELPLANQSSTPAHELRKRIGEPIHELDLEDGDCMYIPRGYVHEASASVEPSLHVTVGVIPVTWGAALSQALMLVSQRDVRFRRSLPVGFGEAGRTDDSVAKQFRELVTILADSTDMNVLVERLYDRFVSTRQPILAGFFDDLANLDEITLETPLAKRADLLSSLQREDGALSLSFHGKKVVLPARLDSMLRFMDAARRFTPASLPGDLDDDGRLVLVRRLVKEGYLTLVSARASGRTRR
jgi:ribosomal protein L16 Arg81 hydroxylase